MDHSSSSSTLPLPLLPSSGHAVGKWDSGDPTTDDDPPVPNPTIQDVEACQFSHWYPFFARLEAPYRGRRNVTIRSVILSPLPPSFVEYLNSDHLILPVGARTSCALLEAAAAAETGSKDASSNGNPEWSSSDDEDDDHDDENVADKTKGGTESDGTATANRSPCYSGSSLLDGDADSDGDDESPPQQFAFLELNRQIEHAIHKELGGACIPKLNWSAPKDAVWANQGTMECRFAGDVYLLLKASDFCSYDLHHASQDVVATANDSDAIVGTSEDYICPSLPNEGNKTPSIDETRPAAARTVELELVLRKWCNLYPSQEFRCFVRDLQLIAISQRHHSQHYPHLNALRDQIQTLIGDFYQEVVRPVVLQMVQAPAKQSLSATCPPTLPQSVLSDYVFDVYIDKKQRVWLLDINVWASRTDSLLYDWSELRNGHDRSGDAAMPLLRLVETSKQVRADPLSSYRAPIDAIHVAAAEGDDFAKNPMFQEFMRSCEKPSSLYKK